MKKTSILALTLMLSAFALSACGTMHGLGHDIEDGGEAIQDAAY